MWGSCFWFCTSARPSFLLPSSRLPPQLTHTHTQLTHNLLTHNLLTHNLPTHNLHTHTHNLPTHNLHTHTQLTPPHNLHTHTTYPHTTHTHTHTQLTPTQLTHTHTQLTHNLLTRNLLTHTHTTYTHTHAHKTLQGRRGTWWHRPSLCVAGVALMALGWLWWRVWFPFAAVVAAALCVAGMVLGDIDPHFAWQAWHLVTSTVTLHGRRGAYGTGLALVTRLVPVCRSPRHFAWQAWYLVTSTVTLRGRRGTWWHRPSLCLAGVALMALGWLWWRAWFPFAAVVTTALCVAGVALGDIDLHFAWQAWHLWHWAGSGDALGSRLPRHFARQAWYLVTSTLNLRGRRGSWWHRPSLCMAGVALMALGWLWWRAWFPFAAVVAVALCAAGVTVGDIDRRFAWQAWHLWHWAGSGDALGSRLPPWSPRLFAWQAWYLVTSTLTLRGRRGTWWHRPSLCVAGVALMALGWLWWRAWFPFAAVVAAGVALGDIDRHFAWQAWHLVTSTVTLHGRRGTYGTGLALVTRLVPISWSPWHFAWQAWYLVTSTLTLRGRRGTWWHRPSLCVAGVALIALGWLWWRAWFLCAAAVDVDRHFGMALGDIDRHFAWQAWHLWHWAGSGGALGSRLPPWSRRHFARQAWRLATSAIVSRGRHGTWRHPPLFHVASVALGDIHLRFTWQAWHLATSTFVLCGRHCPWRHPPLFCVAGLALIGTHTHTQLCHTHTHTHIFVTHTHNFVTHTHIFVTHHLSHTQLCHTPSFKHNFHIHTHLFVTHNFVTPTSLSHTHTHNFVTHHLSHTIFPTHLCHTHTTLSHTIFHTHLCHTHTHLGYTPSLPHTLFQTHTHTQLFHTQHCHTPSFRHNSSTHNSSRKTFELIDHPPPPLSILPSPSCCDFVFWLLEEVDLWGYPVL